MEKKGYLDKYSEKAILITFVLVFMISFTYKLGVYYYDVIPWIFLVSLIASLGSIVGVLSFPIALMYQTFFFNKFTFLPLAFTTLYLALITILIIFVILLKKEKLKTDTNFYLVITLGLVALISTVINGYHIGFGNSEFTHYLEGIMIFMTISIFVSTKRKMRLFCWMLLLAVASIVFRLYNHVYSYDIAIIGFENNYLARVLSFYLPFLLGMFWAEKKAYLKALIMSVFFFTAQGITQLGSRATYIAVGIALPLMFIKNFKKPSTWTLAGLAIIFLMFFASPFLINDIMSIPIALQGTQAEEGSIQGRALVLEYGWETFKQSPIIGYGVYPALFETMMLKRYDWFKSGHNAYVILAVEMGIIGLASYVALFASSIYFCYKAQILSRKKDPYLYHIAGGTMFGIIAIGINQFMINNPWIPTVFISFGLSSSLYYLAKTGHKGTFHIPRSFIILMILLLILASFLFILFLLLNIVL